jgi:hypothetical protein
MRDIHSSRVVRKRGALALARIDWPAGDEPTGLSHDEENLAKSN